MKPPARFAGLIGPLLLIWPFLSPGQSLFAGEQTPPQTPSAQSQPPSAQPQPAEGESPAPKGTEPTAADADLDGWQAQLDKFFGHYLVEPLSAVLFFDFGTGDWLNRRTLEEVECPGCHAKFDTAQTWPEDPVPRTVRCPACEDADIETTTGTSVPLVVLWLLVGAIFFTLRMGFINVRGFWHGIHLISGQYDNPDEPGEVSHFQALASALSATIGLGNIAGVAIAVGTGGPGAIFWMIVAGFLGMTSKFAECSLSQMYRKVDRDGTVSGGPMHYLYAGLKEIKVAGLSLGPVGAVLAVAFAIVCMGGSFGGGCAFQVSQSLGALRAQVESIDPNAWILESHRIDWIYGLIMSAAVGLVIIGGIRRIAATAEKIVPLMCGVYLATTLYILAVNYQQIPWAFAEIFREAFQWDSIYGGFLGVLVIGIRRAAFSNEAGIGSAAIAHAAAKTEEPIREGLVASLGPFIDTVVICTMTGLVILITGAYNDPQYAELVAGNNGAALTSKAFYSVVWWFPWILCVAVVLFAYSTMISWSYYGERCWSHLFGPRASLAYKGLFLFFVMLGAVVTADNVLEFSDLMILSMAFPNILGVALLSGKIRRALDDYWGRYKRGEMEPVDPRRPDDQGPMSFPT